jgi:hypothetical protein
LNKPTLVIGIALGVLFVLAFRTSMDQQDLLEKAKLARVQEKYQLENFYLSRAVSSHVPLFNQTDVALEKLKQNILAIPDTQIVAKIETLQMMRTGLNRTRSLYQSFETELKWCQAQVLQLEKLGLGNLLKHKQEISADPLTGLPTSLLPFWARLCAVLGFLGFAYLTFSLLSHPHESKTLKIKMWMPLICFCCFLFGLAWS